MSREWEPKDFQDAGSMFLYNTPAAALWWRMGRGKTATAATAAVDLLDLGQARRVLIVAPVLVATQTWPNEFKKWDHLAGVNLQVIRHSDVGKRRAQALNPKADVFLINWEMLHWLVAEFPEGEWRWDTVILDESSKVKNQGSRMYKAVEAVRPFIRRITELTGSPATNGLQNVWAPMYLLDRGRRLGRTEDAFRKRFFFTDMSGKVRIRGEPAEHEIHDRISDIVFALKSAVTGGEPEYNRIMLDLPSKVMTDYKKLETQAFLELDTGDKVDPFNAAAVTGKLLQFASGGVYTEHPEWVEVDNTKIKKLGDIIGEAEGDPMIVAYNSTHERLRILREFPQAVWIKDLGDHVEDEWNAGGIPILVMHPASGGHGLNLQFGGSTIVWFSLTWNLEHFEQLIGRLHGRHGQLADVIVHMLMANDTLDIEVDKRLTEKASVQDALILAAERRRKWK